MSAPRKPVVLRPGEGRSYPMGRISALFKADGAETQNRYSISEWWLEAHTKGPGGHSHAEDDVFFVIEGTMSILVAPHVTSRPPVQLPRLVETDTNRSLAGSRSRTTTLVARAAPMFVTARV